MSDTDTGLGVGETPEETIDWLNHRISELERELSDAKRSENIMRIHLDSIREYVRKMFDLIK